MYGTQYPHKIHPLPGNVPHNQISTQNILHTILAHVKHMILLANSLYHVKVYFSDAQYSPLVKND